jgi:hypothetical protein
VIHQISRLGQQCLQPLLRQLASTLQSPQGLGHLREHQLRCDHQTRLKQRLLE